MYESHLYGKKTACSLTIESVVCFCHISKCCEMGKWEKKLAAVGKIWFQTGKSVASRLMQVKSCFFDYVPISVTLRAFKCSEWDRCREQGDEFPRRDMKGHPAQLQTERLRRTKGPQALDRRGGEWVRGREKRHLLLSLISQRSEQVCGSSELRMLNKVCGFFERGWALIWFL